MLLRELLNAYRWDPTRQRVASTVRLVLLHRGAPQDRIEVALERVSSIGHSFLAVLPDAQLRAPKGHGAVQIPLHRVLEVWEGSELVWKASNARPHGPAPSDPPAAMPND